MQSINSSILSPITYDKNHPICTNVINVSIGDCLLFARIWYASTSFPSNNKETKKSLRLALGIQWLTLQNLESLRVCHRNQKYIRYLWILRTHRNS